MQDNNDKLFRLAEEKARNDMRIEDNAAACDMLRKLLADTENKIRSAYNYGFKDGTEQGRAEAIESIVKYSMEKYAESEE